MAEALSCLRKIICEKEEEILKLKQELCRKEMDAFNEKSSSGRFEKLTQSEIQRYSRQLILPEISMSGQMLLKQASVLIVGAGGLGCPVGIYICAAGIGKIGIVDHDIVEINNLHRQIGHSTISIGMQKSKSLKQTLLQINPNVECTAYTMLLNSLNIKEVIEPYSIIVDASDNVPTRYLLNDASVLYNKILVSGSALRFEGQLTVYHYKDGPCYRCLFPTPPSGDLVTNCSDGGVLGAITGVIGSLQALEVIKIATNSTPCYAKQMLLFDGLDGKIRTIKLREKKADCAVCGVNPTVTKLIDYEVFCNAHATDKDLALSLLNEDERISCRDYQTLAKKEFPHVLIDVRSRNELEICSLPNCISIPISEIHLEKSLAEIKNCIQEKNCCENFVVCRRGNDSQKAVQVLQKYFPQCTWKDIKGGLYAWHEEVDSNIPLY